MSVLAFEGRVDLSLGGPPVLSKVSLRFVPGEFVGVLGPNGAGKTTLMRAVLGLVAPGRRPGSPCSGARRRAATRRSATCRRCARRPVSPG